MQQIAYSPDPPVHEAKEQADLDLHRLRLGAGSCYRLAWGSVYDDGNGSLGFCAGWGWREDDSLALD